MIRLGSVSDAHGRLIGVSYGPGEVYLDLGLTDRNLTLPVVTDLLLLLSEAAQLAHHDDDGGTYLCTGCDLPVMRHPSGRWEHAKVADALFCSIITGSGLILADDENARDRDA